MAAVSRNLAPLSGALGRSLGVCSCGHRKSASDTQKKTAHEPLATHEPAVDEPSSARKRKSGRLFVKLLVIERLSSLQAAADL